ncbi:MAG: SEC-C domain-containing protein [Candidatus Solibacter usitatus]|nr:SEC-C domain-containing protein [Candidatus Solibacter usitatus]
MVERIAVAQETLRQPDFDPAGKLLLRLSEDMDSWDSADRDAFFPALLSVMVIARGGAGARMGRAALLKQAGLLSRNVRRECDQMLAEIPSDAVPPPAKGPSPITVYDICAREVIWSEEYEEEELEEDYSPVQEPVRRTAAPGRNDPCWCNSGKKYKKCHLESDERSRQGPREEVRPRPGSNEFAGLRKRLGDFLGEVVPEREMRRALTEFLGPEHEGEEHDSTVLLMDWLLHDWVPPVLGRTVMQEFLVRRGARLTEREREMLQAWSRSFVGFYEVQKLTEGVGITLKDLIFGETFFVHDVSMSTVLAPWDGLLARVVPGERGTELAGVGLTVPRHSIEPLRSWMEEDRAETGLSWREYLKGNWGRVRRQAAEIADRWLQSLQLTNTDGEELLFSKSVYGMTDEAAVVEALRSCPGLQKESGAKQTDENFVWLNQKKTLMANIRIGGGELVLECNSRERVERGKLLLLSVAGDLLRHLRDEFTTQKELKARAAVAPRGVPKRGGEIPKEVRDQVMTRYMEQHYAGWPDIELPALDGKTPREAVRTAKGRAQVIAVLKDFENGEDRKRKAGEPFYDVGRLRTELGLDS